MRKGKGSSPIAARWCSRPTPQVCPMGILGRARTRTRELGGAERRRCAGSGVYTRGGGRAVGRRGRSSEAAAASSIVRGRRSSISIGRRCRLKAERRRTTVPASNHPSRRCDMHCIEGIGMAIGPLQRARSREPCVRSIPVNKNFQCECLGKKSAVRTRLAVFENRFPYQAVQDEPGQENAV